MRRASDKIYSVERNGEKIDLPFGIPKNRIPFSRDQGYICFVIIKLISEGYKKAMKNTVPCSCCTKCFEDTESKEIRCNRTGCAIENPYSSCCSWGIRNDG